MAAMSSLPSARGFSLIETVVALGILITALTGVAQLLVLSAQWSRSAAGANGALLAAQQKLEELRGAEFGYDESGQAIGDPALDVSPETTLDEDLDPYVDWLDAAGDPVDDPDEAVLTRRWRIAALGTGTPDAVVIEVCVLHPPATRIEACLSLVRTRQS
jgi:type II secretory pathway pseudopilin PulG